MLSEVQASVQQPWNRAMVRNVPLGPRLLLMILVTDFAARIWLCSTVDARRSDSHLADSVRLAGTYPDSLQSVRADFFTLFPVSWDRETSSQYHDYRQRTKVGGWLRRWWKGMEGGTG
jgi:hypothetical protein